MESATCGFRSRLRCFTRPRAVFTSTCVPSKSTQTGVTCGLPSELRVARLAKAGFLNRSLCVAGIVAAIVASLLSPDYPEPRIVNLLPPVDRDRQQRQMFDRTRARQRSDVDRP